MTDTMLLAQMALLYLGDEGESDEAHAKLVSAVESTGSTITELEGEMARGELSPAIQTVYRAIREAAK